MSSVNNKLQNESNGAVISELTDDNGNVLSVQQYLEKKITALAAKIGQMK